MALNAFDEAKKLYGQLKQGVGNAAASGSRLVREYPTPASYLSNIKTPTGTVGQNIQRLPQSGLLNPVQIAKQYTQNVRTNPYIQGQVVQPIRQGVSDVVRKPGIVNKGIGALQVAGGIMSGTGGGVAFNALSGGAAGTLRSLRTGAPIQQSIYQGVTKPTSLAQEGLGVNNPLLSLGIDALSGNPKGIIGAATDAKTIAKVTRLGIQDISPRAFNIHPEDRVFLKNVVGQIQSGQKIHPEDAKDLQRLTEHYLGKKWSAGSNKKLAQTFDYFIAKAEGGIQGKLPKASYLVDGSKAPQQPSTQGILPTDIGQPQLKSQRRESLPESVPQVSKDTQDYLSQLGKAQQGARAGEKIGLKAKASGYLAEVKRKMIDSNAPIEDLLTKSEQTGKFNVLPKQDVRLQIDRVLRSPTIAGQFARDNGLEKIIKDAPDLHALDQYMIAKQATRVAEFGKETGRDLPKDSQLVKELGPQYEQYAGVVRDYGKKLKQYMVETGLISKKLSTELDQKYPDYVPLNRIFAEGEVNPQFGSKAVASLSRQSVVQKLEGSKRAIESPVASLLDKTQAAFEQGEKNVAARQIASYRDLPMFKGLINEVKGTVGGKHTISYLEDGVKRTFEVPKDIAEAAKNLDKQQLGLLGEIARLPTRTLQLGATALNLPFTVTNLVKDQVTGFINSNKAANTSIFNPENFVRALFSATKHDELYEELVRNAGGGTSFDISRSQPNLSVEKIRSGRNLASKIQYTVKHPGELLRAVEDIIGRGEELTRIQQYRGTKNALLKEGRTAQDAALLGAQGARSNTANFARSGSWGKVLNSTIPFFNAGIQGARTLVRSFQQRPKETALKMSVSVFLPMATVTAWNLNDPQRKMIYEDINDFEKENNLIIIPDGATKNEKGQYTVIKIPIPPGISNLANLVRRPLEQANGLDPVRFSEIASNLIAAGTSFDTSSPTKLLSSFTPQAVKLGIEPATNTNLFTGKRIVPEYMQNKPPEEQVRPWTSGTARMIGGILNTSPLMVENVIKTGAAGVGGQLLNASDTVLNKMGAIPQEQVSGENPLQNLERRFSKASGGQTMDKAYTDKAKSDSARKEVIRLIKTGRKDEAKQLAQSLSLNVTVGDVKRYEQTMTKRAADLFIQGKKDSAKQLVQDNGITLTVGEVKKAAKRRAVELYRLGLKTDAKQIVDEFGIVLTQKDVQ